MFWQQLINGIVLGCVYALIAVGYTLVYGVIELINFAHGEIYMPGAFFMYTFLNTGIPFYIAFCLSVFLLHYCRNLAGYYSIPTCKTL